VAHLGHSFTSYVVKNVAAGVRAKLGISSLPLNSGFENRSTMLARLQLRASGDPMSQLEANGSP
jgi:hypothetical protein